MQVNPEVTNPGQNGNQQMFAFCDRMGKELGIGTYSSPNESPDRGRRRQKPNDWLESQSGNSPLLPSAEIGVKNISFGAEVVVNGVSCQTPGEEEF